MEGDLTKGGSKGLREMLLVKGLWEVGVLVPANATCWNELVDIGGEGGLLRLLGRGGARSRLVSDSDVYEEEADELILFGLELRPLLTNGEEEFSELFNTLSTLSFSSCSSACFIVLPVLDAMRLCFISVDVK